MMRICRKSSGNVTSFARIADCQFPIARFPARQSAIGNRQLQIGNDIMADRNIHYEAAFEAYLRQRGIPYVAVDEAKRALFANAKLKGFDFVVYSKNGPNLLIDVKGRQCTNGN